MKANISNFNSNPWTSTNFSCSVIGLIQNLIDLSGFGRIKPFSYRSREILRAYRTQAPALHNEQFLTVQCARAYIYRWSYMKSECTRRLHSPWQRATVDWVFPQATQTQVGMYLSHYRLKCTASQQLSSSNVEVQNPYRSVYEVKILFEICSFCRLFFSKNWTCIHNRFVYNVAITVCRSICQVLAFLFSLGVIDNLFIKEYFEISLQNLMLVMS